MPTPCGSDAAGPASRVAKVLIRHSDACLSRYGDSLRVEERKALQSIHQCRSPVMGGRVHRCAHCSKDHFSYHSCNHRLCPTCGSGDTQDWVASELERRLPVEHFLVTFTLPCELRGLCRREAKAFLSAFFASSSQAIKDVLSEDRHLGGTCGFTGVLQTWTQTLELHPHIHYIVPAVGLSRDGELKRPKKKGWLAHGEVFASRLRTLMLKSLQSSGLLDAAQASPLWKKTWNCDVECFGDGGNAVKYLGAYLKKGPVSQSRILSCSESSVTLSVKDRSSGQSRPHTLSGAEFVRRYLQHALPQGFHAVRRYGFMHPRAHAKLESLRDKLGVGMERAARAKAKPESPPPLCPRCREPMDLVGQLSRAPPWRRSIAKIWSRKERAAA